MAYNCPHCQGAIPDAVSKGELTRKIESHNTAAAALEKQITSLQSQLDSAERKHKADIKVLREELTNGHASALAMARLGLDDDAAAVAELLHNRLPAEDRPTLVDWLQGQKADPSTAHPLLKTYFGDGGGQGTAAPPEPGKPAAPAAPAAAAPPTPGLPPPAGTPPSGTPPQWTPESINAMSDAEFLANLGQLSQIAGFDVAASLGLRTSNATS